MRKHLVFPFGSCQNERQNAIKSEKKIINLLICLEKLHTIRVKKKRGQKEEKKKTDVKYSIFGFGFILNEKSIQILDIYLNKTVVKSK